MRCGSNILNRLYSLSRLAGVGPDTGPPSQSADGCGQEHQKLVCEGPQDQGHLPCLEPVQPGCDPEVPHCRVLVRRLWPWEDPDGPAPRHGQCTVSLKEFVVRHTCCWQMIQINNGTWTAGVRGRLHSQKSWICHLETVFLRWSCRSCNLFKSCVCWKLAEKHWISSLQSFAQLQLAQVYKESRTSIFCCCNF